MSLCYDEVRDFLHTEAALLDDKDWDAWLDMYSKEVEFWMPAWDDDGTLTGNPQREVSLMYYPRRDGLEDRVFRIRTGKSTASTPEHRTSHNLSNILVTGREGEACRVRFNWVTFSQRHGAVEHYFGSSLYDLAREADGKTRIRRKKVILKSDRIHQVIDIYHV
ncbi:aromatic-ring-hydroxylating dioxygenase subunit beta [Thauera sinica]|uniref:Aromatic-ring-hydroxylating dioxygenase subunit beta n=1 Tax=Thauera sinica TaxID=2665146 RepID=A0ABW1AQD0_9RHOO|nr:aromatic-ring-hydroxylating dioxygenase subunit beta [Thauera sp. K11]ATE59675.1 benzoate 1,2-dioxygenase small subunit [Thauera sp. K11]